MGDPSSSRTAFVFAGGGSLGTVEVGMLQVLVDRGIRADFVVGASVGAINGAYFAGRPDAEGVRELTRIWQGISRGHVFPISLVGGFLGLFSARNHLVNPARLRHLIERHFSYRTLEEAELPCHVVATDVLTGAEVVLSSGGVVEAVLASTAIPAVFPPILLGGRYLVDGGITNNTPISVAVELGAERVIVLPTGFSCGLDTPPAGTVDMAMHSLSLLIARQLVVDVERFGGRADLRIAPPLCPVSTAVTDFSASGSLIERAAESTRQWIDRGGLESGDVPHELLPHSHTD